MRVRKLFIFYDYKKQIMCVGEDDGQTLGSVLIYSTPVNTVFERIKNPITRLVLSRHV